MSAAPTPAAGTNTAATGTTTRRLVDAGKTAREFESHRLASAEFRQYPHVVMAVNRDGDPYEILPGRLAVPTVTELRDVAPDLTPGVLTDTTFHVEYTTPGGSVNPARISARDMRGRDPEWPAALGVDGRVAPRRLDAVGNAIKAYGATLERSGGWTQAYAATGLILPPGRAPGFLRIGQPALTATGVDPTLVAELPPGVGEFPGVKALALDDPSPATFAEDMLALYGFLDVYPSNPAVPWAMLAQLVLAPWSSLPGVGRVAVVTAGDTGIGKSAIAGILTAAQSREFTPTKERAHEATTGVRHAKASKIGVDRVLYPLNGMLAVVDDFFAGKLTRRDVDEQWRLLSSIGDSAATGSGGVKGTREGVGVRIDRFPRSCVLANAEDLPEEAERGSEVARYVALRMEEDARWSTLDELQGNVRALSRAHATMIQRGLADLDAPRRAVEWARERVAGWRVGGHNRARQGYTQLMAGAYLFAQHCGAALYIDPANVIADAETDLQAAAAAQAARVGMVGGRQLAREPGHLFVKHFREMIAGDPWWLAGVDTSGGENDPSTYRPPVIPGHSPAAVGWRQTGTPGAGYDAGWQAIGRGAPLGSVTVREPGSGGRPPWRPVVLTLPAAGFDRVAELVARRVRDADGWSLPAPAALRAKLAEGGWLKSPDGESAPLWTGAGKTRVLRFDLGRLLNGDDDQGDTDDGDQGEPPPAPEPDPEPTQLSLLGDQGDADPIAVLLAAFPGSEIIEVIEEPPTPAAESPAEPQAPVTPAQRATPAAPPASRPGRRTARRTARAGVLDVDGIRLPGATEPTPAELPASLADAYTLAGTHGLTSLYVMPAAAAALDLPAETDGGKGVGVEHPWANLAGTDLTADPAGRVSRWINIWHAGGDRRATSRAIVLVHLDDDWRDDHGAFPDAATLADTLPRFADALGTEWYMGAPVLARQLANYANRQRGEARQLARCEAIATESVPAVAEYAQPGLANLVRSASRPLTEAESAATVLHRYDRNAAFPSVYEGLVMGIGEPEHRTGPLGTVEFDRTPGYWRTAGPVPLVDQDGRQVIPPALAFMLRLDDGDGGGIWLTTPECELFAKLGNLPTLTEGYVWPDVDPKSGARVRPFATVGKRLRLAREKLAMQTTPGARLALGMVKQIGSSLSGIVNEQARTGDRRDWLWRPDWRHFIRAQAQVNMVDEIIRIGNDTGRWPVAAHVDAVYYAAADSDPQKAAPEGMQLARIGGGKWKPEVWVSVAVIREHLGERSFNRAVAKATGKGE